MGQAIHFMITKVFLPGMFIGLLLGLFIMWEINANRPSTIQSSQLLLVQERYNNIDPSWMTFNKNISNIKPIFGGTKDGKDTNRSG